MSTSDDWKLELNRMLDTIENQLEKIDQRFKVMGRPFSEEFQQHVVKLTNLKWVYDFVNLLFFHRLQSSRHQK